MKIKSLKPGMIVYTVTKGFMGNTKIKTLRVHTAKIISVSEDFTSFTYSWNNNPERKGYVCTASQFKAKEPITVRGPLGNYRMATKEEKEAMKNV